MRNHRITAPRFHTHHHVRNWVAQVLRTARMVWGNGAEYHVIFKNVMDVKRAAMKQFKAP